MTFAVTLSPFVSAEIAIVSSIDHFFLHHLTKNLTGVFVGGYLKNSPNLSPVSYISHC